MPFPSPGDLPHPEIELGFPVLQADSTAELPEKPLSHLYFNYKEERKDDLRPQTQWGSVNSPSLPGTAQLSQ